MKYYAVLDTNVLVSAMLNIQSVPGLIFTEALIGDIIPILHTEIIEEYSEVLHRDKFHFNPEKVEILLNDIEQRGIFVKQDFVKNTMPDPDDIIFYAVTIGARKYMDAYIVTGNLRHFPQEPFVVSPKEMLDIIKRG